MSLLYQACTVPTHPVSFNGFVIEYIISSVSFGYLCRFPRGNGEDAEGYEIAWSQESCKCWSAECPYSLLRLIISWKVMTFGVLRSHRKLKKCRNRFRVWSVCFLFIVPELWNIKNRKRSLFMRGEVWGYHLRDHEVYRFCNVVLWSLEEINILLVRPVKRLLRVTHSIHVFIKSRLSITG
jgi:hypothetical protein